MEPIEEIEIFITLPVKVKYIPYGGSPALSEAGQPPHIPEEGPSVEVMSMTVYGDTILTGYPEVKLRVLQERILEESA